MKSADGKRFLKESDIICLSFVDDICRFMDILMEKEEDAVIKEIARQYKEAIETFTAVVDEELSTKISELLLSSENNFRSMLAIEQVANKAKAVLIYKVMQEMEKSLEPLMKKYGFERESRFSWYEYPEKATEEYYKQKGSTYPGINYVVKNATLADGIELWFRVKIDYVLYAGLCLFDTQAETEWGKGDQLDNPDENVKTELAKYLDLKEAVYDAWWVQWWYLPTASDDRKIDTEMIPNFKEMNEAAVLLADDSKRKEFINRAVEAVDIMLKKLIL